jgi:multiple sugar transport system ATP-binding protein
VDGTALQQGESVELGLRPEHCVVDNRDLGPDDTALQAQIVLVEHLGDSNLLHLKTDAGQELVARGDGNAAVRLGDAVTVRAAPESLYLFRSDGSALRRLLPGNMRAANVH